MTNESTRATEAPVVKDDLTTAPARDLDVEASFQKWWATPEGTTGKAPCDFMLLNTARAAYFAASRTAAQGAAPDNSPTGDKGA